MKKDIFSKRLIALLMVALIGCTSLVSVSATSDITSEESSEIIEGSSEVDTPELVKTYPMAITIKDNKNQVLPNLEFEVRDQNGNTLNFITNNKSYEVNERGFYKVVTSDEEGKIKLTGLKRGTYTIIYSNNNSGYTSLNNSVITVDESNSTATIQLKQNVGNFIFTLTDESDSSIKGAKFTILNSNNEKVNFSISNGIYVPDENGSEILETNTAGRFTIENLPVGDYTLNQTEAPVEYNGTLIKKTFGITLGNETKIADKNTKEYGDIKISAIDSKTNTILVKSEYNIYDANGNKVFFTENSGIYYFTRTEGSDLVKTDSAGSVFLSDLPVGIYTIKEITSPTGYDKAVDVNFTIEKNKELTATVKNNKSVGTLEVNVTDSTTNESVASYTFNILNSKNEVIKFTKKSDGNYIFSTTGTVSDLISDANGKIVIADLPEGAYVVKQTKAAAGYIVDGAGFSQNIKSQQTTTYNAQVSKSNASLSVVNEKSEPVANVDITIKDINGNIVLEGITNENGKFLISGVSAGDYTYVINNTTSPYLNKEYSQTFKINQKGGVENLDTCILEYTKLTISLGDKLAGATFQLVDKANANNILTAETDENGIAIFTQIQDGTYTLSQTKAPEGYEVSVETQDVVIGREYSEMATITFTNEGITSDDDTVIPSEDPSTSENPEEKPESKIPTIYIVIALVILLVLGATVYAVIKAKKDDDEDQTEEKPEKPTKVEKVAKPEKAPKVQRTERPAKVEKETPVKPATPTTPVIKEEPIKRTGPSFYVEEDEDEEVLPDIDLSRPEDNDFFADPYAQEAEENMDNTVEEMLDSLENIEVGKAIEVLNTDKDDEIETLEDLEMLETPISEIVQADNDEEEDGISLDELLSQAGNDDSEEQEWTLENIETEVEKISETNDSEGFTLADILGEDAEDSDNKNNE